MPGGTLRKVVVNIKLIENRIGFSPSTPIRVEPVQARSAARVSALLDAAANVIHDVGYEQLTTAMVAESAGASIGTVYRYFPDRIAVLKALAARNLDRVVVALRHNLLEQAPASLSAAVTVTVNTLVAFFRQEQGFRSLRVGDVLDIRPMTGGRGGNADIASVVRDYLHESQGLMLDSKSRVAVETAIDVIDALLGRSFMYSDRGDSTVLAEVTRVSQRLVEDLSA